MSNTTRSGHVGAVSLAVLLTLVTFAVACSTTATVDSSRAVAEAATPETDDSPPPTVMPTASPVPAPTVEPASPVEAEPTAEPEPTAVPTTQPTAAPAPAPTPDPTATAVPTPTPSPEPTAAPRTAAALIDNALGVSKLDDTTCPADVAAAQVSCFVATLPLDIADPGSGETVELLVARVDNGDPQGIGPVVYLQGGPGVGSATLARFYVGAAHDVLFVDQRGTGHSEPKLNCPEIDDIWETGLSDDSSALANASANYDRAFADCHGRLAADGVAFEHFNTSAAAADFTLVRRLLGYEEWSIWGISYGTRLGLTMMRDHPEGIRAAVLDSVVPFEVDFFATIPENAFGSMVALDEACNASQCADDHGSFIENLAALVARLDENPVTIDAARFGTGEPFRFRIDGDQLLSMVFIQLYSTQELRSLPRQIARPDNGGLNELVSSYVQRRDPNRIDLAVGLYYSTWCREEFPFYDETIDDAFLAEVEAQFGESAAVAFSSDGLAAYCDIYAVPASNPRDDESISTEIPTLVFAGAFDPITPPAWSRQVADALGNAIYVEMADHGHGMATSCPRGLRTAFLADPSTPLDLTCVTQVTAPQFD